MTDNENSKRDQLRDSWIDALLVSATNPQDHSDRIARAMRQIESGSETDGNPSVSPHPGHPKRAVRWTTFGLALTILVVGLLFFPGDRNQSAVAAIQRSLDVAAELMARKYLLQIHFRVANDRVVQIDNDLYVRGNDHFAMRHPGLIPGTGLWLGQSGSDSWVLPAMGPVLKGDNTLLSRYLRSRQELDTPYLHLKTALTRMMSQGYQLKTLDDTEITIPDGRSIMCRHIRADLSSSESPSWPHSIELWTSIDTGMAIRLVANWNLAEGETGRESILLTFQQDEPNLPEAWFTAEGHYQGERPVIGAPKN